MDMGLVDGGVVAVEAVDVDLGAGAVADVHAAAAGGGQGVGTGGREAGAATDEAAAAQGAEVVHGEGPGVGAAKKPKFRSYCSIFLWKFQDYLPPSTNHIFSFFLHLQKFYVLSDNSACVFSYF